MSARFYSSPTLHLKIGNSRLRDRLLLGLCVAVGAALWALAQRGYAGTACTILPLLITLLWSQRRYRDEGLEFGWRPEHWYLLHAGEVRDVDRLRRAVLTPWVIHLEFQGKAGRNAVLVFVDSVPAHEWRRLRARLTLDSVQRA